MIDNLKILKIEKILSKDTSCSHCFKLIFEKNDEKYEMLITKQEFLEFIKNNKKFFIQGKESILLEWFGVINDIKSENNSIIFNSIIQNNTIEMNKFIEKANNINELLEEVRVLNDKIKYLSK